MLVQYLKDHPRVLATGVNLYVLITGFHVSTSDEPPFVLPALVLIMSVSIWARKWLIRFWIRFYTFLFQNRYKAFRVG